MKSLRQINSENEALKSTLRLFKNNRYPPYVISAIESMLNANRCEGGSIEDFKKVVFNEMLKSKEASLDYLNKSHSIMIDAFSKFSACYNKAFAKDLGLEWYMYTGSNLTTTRIFCLACTAKKYIHESEFENIIRGNFEEYKKFGGKVNEKTGLAERLDPKTTVINFTKYRGGRGCMHQMIPVDDSIIPKDVKEKIYSSEDYKKWKQ